VLGLCVNVFHHCVRGFLIEVEEIAVSLQMVLWFVLAFLIFRIANTAIDAEDIKWRFILQGNSLGYLHVVVFENI